MNRLLYPIFIFLACFGSLHADEPYLLLNMANKMKLPKNFRIDTHLNASASGQFSTKSLETMLKAFPKDKSILVVDLRQESHGFANGAAISWRKPPKNWANIDKTLPEIIQDEKTRLKQLESHRFSLIYHFGLPFPIYVRSTQTEEELTESFYLNYLRIPVADHRRPADADVDHFILSVRGLPSNAFVAFHCAAGKGRSTIFICMYDMIRNAKKTSYEAILERQYKSGGVDYLAVKANAAWKQSDFRKKQELLKNFYQYCRESDPLTVLWTEWLSKRELKISAF